MHPTKCTALLLDWVPEDLRVSAARQRHSEERQTDRKNSEERLKTDSRENEETQERLKRE